MGVLLWGSGGVSPLKWVFVKWQFPAICVSGEGTSSSVICDRIWVTAPHRWCEAVIQCPLEWHHNGRDSVSNHQPHDCLLNRLFRRRSKKTPNSASLAFVRGIHRGPVNSQHKWPVKRKMFPFDDVIMLTQTMAQIDKCSFNSQNWDSAKTTWISTDCGWLNIRLHVDLKTAVAKYAGDNCQSYISPHFPRSKVCGNLVLNKRIYQHARHYLTHNTAISAANVTEKVLVKLFIWYLLYVMAFNWEIM